MRIRPLLAACLSLAALATAAPAQDSGGGKPGVPPTRRRSPEGPVFAPPEKEKPPAPTEPPPAAEPPRGEIDLLVGQLLTWPSAEARAAAEALHRRWAESKPAVMALLVKPTPQGRGVGGAAFVLHKTGDPDGIAPLLGTLRDPRNFRWCGEVLEAVVALDPLGAKDRLFPLLSVPSSQVVDRVARTLAPLLGSGDIPRLRELFTSKLAPTRRVAMGLASEADFDAVRGDLVEALGDRSPEVTLAAAVTLGLRADGDILARLNTTARGDEPRKGAFAVIGLALAGERHGDIAFEDATIASLIGSRGLRSSDPVARTVAALALADIGYLRPDPVIDPLMETEIVPALLEVVAGTRFFSDLVLLKPHVMTRLKRLCPGTQALFSAPDWVQWWDAHRGSFVARRVLLSLPPGTRGSLRVRVEGREVGGAGPCVYSARAEEAPPGGGAGGRFVALSGDEAAALAAAVEESGLLALTEASHGAGDDSPLTVAVETGNRGRTVRASEGTDVPAGVRTLLEGLEALREANRWQRWWNRRRMPTFVEFVDAERPFWSGGAGPEKRAIRLVGLAIGSLRELDSEEDRLEALRFVAKSTGVREGVDHEGALTLASFAAVGSELSPTGAAALEVLAAAGRTEGLSPLRSRIEAATDDYDRAPLLVLLERTFAGAPLDAVLPAADAGTEALTRSAAVRSLGSRDASDQRVIAAVRRATTAEEPSVRGAGYMGLGRLRVEGALEVLEYAAAKEPDPEARAGALEALGCHGGPDVVALLGRAMTVPEPWARAAAIRGLAACREPEGLTFVLTALTSDPDGTVRAEAERAVQALGGDRAREALRTVAMDRRREKETRIRAVEGLEQLGPEGSLADLRALMTDPEPEVADAAAFALAWIRDGESVPRVLDALGADRSPARALRSMELLSLESFRGMRDREEAVALFTGWYEVSRGRGPRGWLVEALTVRGIGDASLKDFESGANPRVGVPALVKAFRNAPWYLRRAADLELRRISGRSQGEVGPWTTDAEAAALEEAWKAWWDGERGGSR